METGIYTITNRLDGKRYVGSSKNFATRWRVHTSLLRRGKHHNASGKRWASITSAGDSA